MSIENQTIHSELVGYSLTDTAVTIYIHDRHVIIPKHRGLIALSEDHLRQLSNVGKVLLGFIVANGKIEATPEAYTSLHSQIEDTIDFKYGGFTELGFCYSSYPAICREAALHRKLVERQQAQHWVGCSNSSQPVVISEAEQEVHTDNKEVALAAKLAAQPDAESETRAANSTNPTNSAVNRPIETPLTDKEIQEELKELSERPRLSVRNPDEILAMHFNEDDLYLENGIFARGQPLTILGPGGIGKSGLLLLLAVCTITGRDFLGWKVGKERLKWLIVQSENSCRRLKADLQKLQQWLTEEEWALVNQNLRIHTLEADHDHFLGLNDHSSKELVAQLIRETAADVVVFDPLYAFSCGNLQSDVGMQKTIQSLTKLARLGKPDCAIVILHHTITGKEGAKKATGFDRTSYGRGSKALQLWTRGQINVAPGGPDDNSHLVISCGKNSNGPEFEPFGIFKNSVTMTFEIDEEFDHAAWIATLRGEATGKAKPTPEAIAQLVANLPLQRKELAERVMEEFCCGKSSAYAFITKAEGKTIRLNSSREYEAIP